MRALRLLLVLAAWCFLPTPAAAQTPTPCTIASVFQELRDTSPSEIGECRGSSLTDDNGDTAQATSRGLLQLRKADSWTAFIGARHTLVLGPDGPARRLNVDRFDWELNGLTPELGMFGDAGSGLLPTGVFGFGFEVADVKASESAAMATIIRSIQSQFRGTRSIVQTVQVLPTPDVAHSLFIDVANLQQGDLVLKTTQLGDETHVVGWKPDDTSSFSATFRQLAITVRRSNAVVSIALVPGLRLDYGVQLVSMVFGRLR